MGWGDEFDIESMKGQTFTDVYKEDGDLIFESPYITYIFTHDQD